MNRSINYRTRIATILPDKAGLLAEIPLFLITGNNVRFNGIRQIVFRVQTWPQLYFKDFRTEFFSTVS